MKHRPIRLLIILALALFVAPLTVRAQHADRMRKIGVLQQYGPALAKVNFLAK